MAKESARIRRRRAAIARRRRELEVVTGARGGSQPRAITAYYRRVAAGKVRGPSAFKTKEELAHERVMESWDALRRAELREARARGSVRTGLGILPRRDEQAFFDPLALPTVGYTSHAEKHSLPSHHRGSCDEACRRGLRPHTHRGTRRFNWRGRRS